MTGWRGGASISGLAISLFVAGCTVAPSPYTEQEFADWARSDRERMYSSQEALSGPISLYEAMARGIAYNLEHRLKLMEGAVAAGDAKIARFDLLPRLTQTAGYTARDTENASRSKNLATNVTSNEYSASSEKQFATANLSLAWNVLDFGVSWLRARQQADSILVTEERRRKTVQNILQDIRFAYWRAYGAQRLLPKVERLLVEVKNALAQAREAEQQGLQQAQSLEYQVQLLETVRQINAVKKELIFARAELAALMNLPPGMPYVLAAPDDNSAPEIKVPLEKLQQTALFLRPEIREQRYQERITVAETTKTLLRFLPGIEINVDRQYTGNSYTLNQSWVEGGLKLTWNLMNLWGADDKFALAQAKEELVRRQQLALGVAVMTQVNVAWLRFQQAHEDFGFAHEMFGAASRLEEQGNKARSALAESGLEVIRRTTRSVYMELQRDTAMAELQNAAGRLYGSVGFDPVFGAEREWKLAELSVALKAQMTEWDKGNLAVPDEVETPKPTANESADDDIPVLKWITRGFK
ncbi:Outer membrane efflux protein [Magnetospirillum sp. LM-5]|uniref:TolC family protein n=1 Tax=Magnetospirillum sp. LM-5 TaxID=2681466 RepID=UPI0013845B93|nr:TolC family protein [Magnetospirillum sp. LM-5]CAA7623551.1 Outer membrane efflux protein [Magnetospirillum sp. LM-5]